MIEEYPEASRREVENRLMEIWCKLPSNHQKRYFEKAEKLAKKYNTSASLSYMKRFKNAPKKVSTTNTTTHKLHQPKAVHVQPSPSPAPSVHAVATDNNNNNHKISASFQQPQHQYLESNLLNASSNAAGVNSNDDIEDQTLFDDFILSDCFDYKKAVKETATYNSPMNKELKKKLNKSFKDDINSTASYQDASSINLDDEHSFSTGILVDIMIASANSKEEKMALLEDLPQLKSSSWSPLDGLGDLVGGDGDDTTGDLTTLDVSALDDFLTGADVSGINRSSFLDEPALTSSPKPTKPRRKTQTRSRTKKTDRTGAATTIAKSRSRTRKKKAVVNNNDDEIKNIATIDTDAIADTTTTVETEKEMVQLQPEDFQDLL